MSIGIIEKPAYVIAYEDIDETTIKVSFVDVLNPKIGKFYYEFYFNHPKVMVADIPDTDDYHLIQITVTRKELEDMTIIAKLVRMLATSHGYNLEPYQRKYL